MFYTWFQRADFTTKENHFDDKNDVVTFWHSVDSDKEDAIQRKRVVSGEDFCQWGVGILAPKGRSFHIYRSSDDENTFNITLSKRQDRRFLGVLPLSPWKNQRLNDLTRRDVIHALQAFLDFVEGDRD